MFIFEVCFVLKIEDNYCFCLVFHELKLNAKEGIANERTH